MYTPLEVHTTELKDTCEDAMEAAKKIAPGFKRAVANSSGTELQIIEINNKCDQDEKNGKFSVEIYEKIRRILF